MMLAKKSERSLNSRIPAILSRVDALIENEAMRSAGDVPPGEAPATLAQSIARTDNHRQRDPPTAPRGAVLTVAQSHSPTTSQEE